MNILLSTVGILLVVTGSMGVAIGKLEADEHQKNDIGSMEKDEKLQVGRTKSKELANLETNKVSDSIEDKKSWKKPLKSTINVNEDNFNTSAVFQKLLGLIKSLNATAKDSKFTECAYEGVKAFVVCELHGPVEMEDPVGFFPFIKCASTAAMEFANCFFHTSASLHNPRKDIKPRKDTNAIYKTSDTIMKSLVNFEDFNVQNTFGTDYYFEYEDTTPEVNYSFI
ncbi:hypothetical protein MSG28_013687 [Choristoneura fumiferana]|uniref:Uncharacterized protein n=1 Tax=Choristoneura fumiferana TaxID=7141 RepID=A0ACC0K8J4_CHOFU|nr:hypothetical protein MSG28_013687 [Choristoneura fumiferana]